MESGGNPLTAFNTSVYDAGYQPVGGGPIEWARWDIIARGNLDNSWRLGPILHGMELTG